jgi:hypothetical protein
MNVHPGQTANVKRLLEEIEEIKTIDACWGKPDLFTRVVVSNQEALTKLVLTKNSSHRRRVAKPTSTLCMSSNYQRGLHDVDHIINHRPIQKVKK